MTYVLALLAGIVGAALGFALGAAVAALLATVLGLSDFEGASGYFVVFVGGPIGAVLGLILGAVLVLRRSGHRGFGAMGWRLALVVAGVAALGAAALGVFWAMRPIINTDGPAPQLVFEIRLPPGAAPPDANLLAIELQTSKNRMPGRLELARREDGRPVLSGSVEMYYRTRQRTLVLTMPDRTEILFEIRLGLSPTHAASFGAWQPADYIAEPDKAEVRRANAADRYEIRYRTVWAGED